MFLWHFRINYTVIILNRSWNAGYWPRSTCRSCSLAYPPPPYTKISWSSHRFTIVFSLGITERQKKKIGHHPLLHLLSQEGLESHDGSHVVSLWEGTRALQPSEWRRSRVALLSWKCKTHNGGSGTMCRHFIHSLSLWQHLLWERGGWGGAWGETETTTADRGFSEGLEKLLSTLYLSFSMWCLHA